MMPPRGNEARSEAIAELSSLYHSQLTEPALADLLDTARAAEQDPERLASIREMEREYRWATCIPSDLVKAKSLAGSKCEHQWRSQRQDNDWRGFLRNFKEVVNLSRVEAQARQTCNSEIFSTPYDALLDQFGEPSREHPLVMTGRNTFRQVKDNVLIQVFINPGEIGDFGDDLGKRFHEVIIPSTVIQSKTE